MITLTKYDRPISTKDDYIELLKANLANANVAVQSKNWASALASIENAAFWANRLDTMPRESDD